jgi:peptidyl-tRNA hydrolase, PTH1 family
MIRLVVGLGNPGVRYERTRHNIGFMVVRQLAEQNGVTLKVDGKFLGWTGKGKAHFLLPATFMNESGQAVRKTCDFYRIAPEEVLVVVDDVELPLGVLRLRSQGSSGGHNGLKSIERSLGTSNYPRLRVGIGREGHGDLTGHVLGQFSAEEGETLPEVIGRAAGFVERTLAEPIEDVMIEANQKEKENDQS